LPKKQYEGILPPEVLNTAPCEDCELEKKDCLITIDRVREYNKIINSKSIIV
jgi:hypothetical protein